MEDARKKRLAIFLSVAMVFTMLMGPGPGLRLINPDVNGVAESFSVAGIPVIYLWGLLWFFVQVVIVVVAYFTVWNEQDEVTG